MISGYHLPPLDIVPNLFPLALQNSLYYLVRPTIVWGLLRVIVYGWLLTEQKVVASYNPG